MIHKSELPEVEEGRKREAKCKCKARTVHGNPIVLINTIFQLNSDSVMCQVS